MIKIIASDMDDTLLDSNSELPKGIHSLLDTLDSKQIEFVAASGRSLISLRDKFGPLADKISFVSDNGAMVQHMGETIYSSTIENEYWSEMALTGLDVKETSVILIAEDGAYRISQIPEHTEKLMNYFGYAKEIQNIDEVQSKIIKATFLSLNHSLENFNDHFNPKFGDSFNVTFGGAIWVDITNKNVNKGTGLQILLDKYNFSPENLMAFGDYLNDLEMLMLAGYSYAVDNAHDDLKAVAHEIIENHNDNAVVNKILEMI